MPKLYTVSDGKLILTMQPAPGGWYAVTTPMDPSVHTQARSVEEAFLMAYDAIKLLEKARSERNKAHAPKVTTRVDRKLVREARPKEG